MSWPRLENFPTIELQLTATKIRLFQWNYAGGPRLLPRYSVADTVSAYCTDVGLSTTEQSTEHSLMRGRTSDNGISLKWYSTYLRVFEGSCGRLERYLWHSGGVSMGN